MGIAVNAASITIGCFLGGLFKEYLKPKNFTVLSIGIMIISMVGFFENIFDVSYASLKSNDLLVVVFSLIIGSVLGDAIDLDGRIAKLGVRKDGEVSPVMDATIFFAVGGLQICGAILLVTENDSSQLVLKSLVDFPFALMFGISYGKKVALSALPVATGQIMIALLTRFFNFLISPDVIRQICSMGYIILFFSGFNLICNNKYKVNNTNMLIGIIIILVYNIIIKLWG